MTTADKNVTQSARPKSSFRMYGSRIPIVRKGVCHGHRTGGVRTPCPCAY